VILICIKTLLSSILFFLLGFARRLFQIIYTYQILAGIIRMQNVPSDFSLALEFYMVLILGIIGVGVERHLSKLLCFSYSLYKV